MLVVEMGRKAVGSGAAKGPEENEKETDCEGEAAVQNLRVVPTGSTRSELSQAVVGETLLPAELVRLVLEYTLVRPGHIVCVAIGNHVIGVDTQLPLGGWAGGRWAGRRPLGVDGEVVRGAGGALHFHYASPRFPVSSDGDHIEVRKTEPFVAMPGFLLGFGVDVGKLGKQLDKKNTVSTALPSYTLPR